MSDLGQFCLHDRYSGMLRNDGRRFYTVMKCTLVILDKLQKPWEIWICGKGTVAVYIIDKASIKTQGQTKFSTEMRKYHFCSRIWFVWHLGTSIEQRTRILHKYCIDANYVESYVKDEKPAIEIYFPSMKKNNAFSMDWWSILRSRDLSITSHNVNIYSQCILVQWHRIFSLIFYHPLFMKI